MRIGEALGLRHNDIAAARREVTVRQRDNANGARVKSTVSRTIPVSGELIRLYADYLHAEYGDLDSDYMFVNLWAHPHGHPLTYAAVYDLVRRLRRRPGSTSTRTGCDTRPRPGCCATESASRSSRICSDTRMWPRPRRMGTSPWRMLGGPWSRSVGSPAGRCSCDRGVAEACRSVGAAGQADGRGP